MVVIPGSGKRGDCLSVSRAETSRHGLTLAIVFGGHYEGLVHVRETLNCSQGTTMSVFVEPRERPLVIQRFLNPVSLDLDRAEPARLFV
jgi:hypothetical protein